MTDRAADTWRCKARLASARQGLEGFQPKHQRGRDTLQSQKIDSHLAAKLSNASSELNEGLEEMDSELILVADAAKLVGKAQVTIRRLVETKALKSKRDENGRHLINRMELVAYYAAKSANRAGNDVRAGATTNHANSDILIASELAKVQAENSGLASKIAMIEESLLRERRLNDELRAQNRDIQNEIVKISAEIRAILTNETQNKLFRWFRN